MKALPGHRKIGRVTQHESVAGAPKNRQRSYGFIYDSCARALSNVPRKATAEESEKTSQR